MQIGQVTLFIENADGTLTPSGWSTSGKTGSGPFRFSPGVRLIEGWTIGALSMRVGERCLLHVPAVLGYGAREQGNPSSGSWHIPPNSNLMFDLEIVEEV